MAHPVTCYYCKERFDRDKCPAVIVPGTARTYAHKTCADERQQSISQEELEYNELEKYLNTKFGTKYLTANIRKQIRDFKRDYGYKFDGMRGALIWWFDIQGHIITEETEHYGIAILPFIYDDARKYFEMKEKARQINESLDLSKPAKTIYIEIESPQPYNIKQPKLLKMKED